MDPLHRPAGTLSRRHLLTRVFPAIVAVPTAAAALGGCSLLSRSTADAPDPIPGLADAARADAALAASIITADPGQRARLEPLRAARTTHAAALDRLLGRAPSAAVPAAVTAPATATPRPTAGSAPATGGARASKASLAQLHDALTASAAAATDAALVLPAEKVGTVASVAACCAAYAALL